MRVYGQYRGQGYWVWINCYVAKSQRALAGFRKNMRARFAYETTSIGTV